MTTTETWFEKAVKLAGAYSYKNMKKMPAMEGLAWCGDLCLHGRKIGYVHDEGCGGPLIVEIDAAYKAQVNADSVAYYKQDPEHEEITEKTFEYMTAEEFFLPWLADRQDSLKSLKTKCKNRVIVINETCKKDGEYLMYKVGSVAQIAAIKAKYPDHFYINDQF